MGCLIRKGESKKAGKGKKEYLKKKPTTNQKPFFYLPAGRQPEILRGISINYHVITRQTQRDPPLGKAQEISLEQALSMKLGWTWEPQYMMKTP